MPQYKASCWCSGLPGVINHAHLKHHSADSQRVGVPGARIFTHLRVGCRGTDRVRGRLCDGVSLGNIRNPKRGDITFGMMTAFLQLVAQIQNPTVELSSEVPASQATRRNLSYVPQGNTLFSGTVRENLRMGNPEATDEEMTADIGCPQDGSRRRSSIAPLKNHRVNSADYERKHAPPFRGDRDLLSFPQQDDDLLEESVVADN